MIIVERATDDPWTNNEVQFAAKPGQIESLAEALPATGSDRQPF